MSHVSFFGLWNDKSNSMSSWFARIQIMTLRTKYKYGLKLYYNSRAAPWGLVLFSTEITDGCRRAVDVSQRCTYTRFEEVLEHRILIAWCILGMSFPRRLNWQIGSMMGLVEEEIINLERSVFLAQIDEALLHHFQIQKKHYFPLFQLCLSTSDYWFFVGTWPMNF